MKITDRMIETAAEAAWRSWIPGSPWPPGYEGDLVGWRKAIRAAFRAALAVSPAKKPKVKRRQKP